MAQESAAVNVWFRNHLTNAQPFSLRMSTYPDNWIISQRKIKRTATYRDENEQKLLVPFIDHQLTSRRNIDIAIIYTDHFFSKKFVNFALFAFWPAIFIGNCSEKHFSLSILLSECK
jgi:hypothetical protein